MAEKAKPSALKQARIAFVKQKMAEKGISQTEARTRFYVQTRMKEMKAAGKEVNADTRKMLRQKFLSGNVKRADFGAPAAGKKRVDNSSQTAETNRQNRLRKGNRTGKGGM